MAWLDDRIWAHPKVTRCSVAARWIYVSGLCYSSGFGLYGRLTKAHLRIIGCTPKHRRELVDAGLWDDVEDVPGAIDIHDWDEHNAKRDATIEQRRHADRRRQAVKRNPELRAIVRERDADLCRYCGRKVDFADRKSPNGGTYDHVDPRGDNSPENLVVSCRSDNSKKGDRTPEQAGMRLLPPCTESRSDQGRDLDSKSGANQGRDLDNDPDVSRARAGARPMTSDRVTNEEENPKTSAGTTTSTTDHDDNGLPFEIRILVARLMEHIGDHADTGTRHIIETYARDLPEASLAKALESSITTGPDDRARYIVGVLASERDDPEPGPRSEFPRAGAAS